ncbi:alpha-galactosidase [Ilyomonas limi]|nr:alpha-galactosidase [Ilyomonas limi]
MKVVTISILLFTILNTTLAQAQKTIAITTNNNALVLQTDEDNRLNIVHFGQRLADQQEYGAVASQYNLFDNNAGMYNNAYTPAGTFNLSEPAIAITHADGNMSLELKYVSSNTQQIDDNTSLTAVVLKDPVYATEVTLFYKAWNKENVIEQWSVIKNNEKKPVKLEKYASANLYFVAGNYYLTHYHGAWAHEMNPEEEQLTHGIKTIDSKLGTRTNLFEPPSFMISFDKPAGEDEGKVLLGQLAWSGNFKIDCEVDSYNNLRLIAGINPYASEYLLAAGQEFQTPSFIYTYSQHGKGEASRNLHRWATRYRIVNGEGSRLTLLNNWESTYFDFDENKLVSLFKGAKELGVDLFLLDDGWFGNKHPRNADTAGLGDWQENVQKLPHGIGYLVKEAAAAGVKFGIWVEPEMVNPKSELYEKHIDWVIRQPQRPEIYFRNQLVLDLSNPEVQNFVFRILDSLFIKNPGLAYLKWDCNAVIYNAHSAYLQKQGLPQSQLYVAYVKGLYNVMKRFRDKYPQVPVMLCSGGGGRVDYGALQYFTEYWPSDNTDPLERIFIQWENSYFYPAIASCNHVTNWSHLPIKYRTDVAMMGKLGYDVDVSKLESKDWQFSKQAVATYDSIKDVVWHGDLYRLVNPRENNIASLMFVDSVKSKAVMFTYLVSSRFGQTSTPLPVKLKGLDATRRYHIREINLYPDTKSSIDASRTYSGDFLMTVGFNPGISQRRASVVLEIAEEK